MNASDFDIDENIEGFQSFMKQFSKGPYKRANWKEFELLIDGKLPPEPIIKSLRGALQKGLPLTELKFWLSGVTTHDIQMMRDLLLESLKGKAGRKMKRPQLSLV